MIRVINFLCFAVAAFCCLSLYRVSEQTRVARAELHSVQQGIAQEREFSEVLQAEWARVADASALHHAAQSQGAGDSPAVELSSVTLLPRRGENVVGDAEVRSASVIVPIRSEIAGR